MSITEHKNAHKFQGTTYGTAIVLLDYTDLTGLSSGTSKTVTWETLAAAHPLNASSVPAGAQVLESGLNRIRDFTGPSHTAIALSLGGDDPDELLAALDIFTGAKATAVQSTMNGDYEPGTTEDEYTPSITIDTTDDDVKNVTAGCCEVFIHWRLFQSAQRVIA
jgi:hypothetical protein